MHHKWRCRSRQIVRYLTLLISSCRVERPMYQRRLERWRAWSIAGYTGVLMLQFKFSLIWIPFLVGLVFQITRQLIYPHVVTCSLRSEKVILMISALVNTVHVQIYDTVLLLKQHQIILLERFLFLERKVSRLLFLHVLIVWGRVDGIQALQTQILIDHWQKVWWSLFRDGLFYEAIHDFYLHSVFILQTVGWRLVMPRVFNLRLLYCRLKNRVLLEIAIRALHRLDNDRGIWLFLRAFWVHFIYGWIYLFSQLNCSG